MQTLTIVYSSGILVPVNRSEKNDKIRKRCLRTVLDNYENNYDILLIKSGKATMEMKQLRVPDIEFFNTDNNLNLN